jgi:cytoskeletal protein RodZ
MRLAARTLVVPVEPSGAGPGHPEAPRAILADVSIGGTLADARQRAGLTVAEVSTRTRIGQGLIRAIEQDEFGACGGDFYVRGHIRAIASAVGANSQALVSQYDAAHPSDSPLTLEELLKRQPPRTPRSPRQGRRRRRWLVPAVYLFWLAAIGFVAIQLTSGSGDSQPPLARSSSHAAAQTPAASHSPQPSPRSASGSGPASPLPAPAIPLTRLKPVSAAAFGPNGTSDGDNPSNASLALSGDPATPWHTSWYTTARFGNLQAGTGLLLDLGRTVTATSVTIRLGSTPGADLQVRAGTTPAGLHVVASAADAGGPVRLRLASQPHVRYLLIWFTRLPPDAAGTYQAYISNVTVTAYAK